MAERLFANLPIEGLAELAALCRESAEHGPTRHAVQQAIGAASADDTMRTLDCLRAEGWSSKQIATLVQQLSMSAQGSETPERLFDLVLSGPEVEGIPTRETAAIMHTLFADAMHEVLLVGYAVYNGPEIFQRLAERMQERPELRVWMFLDIPRPRTDTSLESEIVRRFASDFFHRHWPWPAQPELFYDPRSLSRDSRERSSLHAKCVIVDRQSALITSANFTAAAQRRNIEAGVVIAYEPFVIRIAEYFEGLKLAGFLRPVNTEKK